jgi:ABC-type transport system involved in multi-copper enzyme maturation permease subunit
MLRLLRVEIEKLLYSRLFYAALALFLVYALVMLTASATIMGLFSGGTAVQVTGAVYLYLTMLLSYYPFLGTMAILFGAVSVAQERKAGTLRYEMLAPFARWKYVVTKFLVVTIAVAAVTLFLFLVIGGIATAFLGPGNVMTYDVFAVAKMAKRDATLLNDQETVQRCLLALPLAAYSALANAAAAFLVSTLVDSVIVAITVPLSLYFISSMVQFSPFFGSLKPWLPTKHMFFFDEVFNRKIPWEKIQEGLVFHTWLIAVFFAVAVYLFVTRDVTD